MYVFPISLIFSIYFSVFYLFYIIQYLSRNQLRSPNCFSIILALYLFVLFLLKVMIPHHVFFLTLKHLIFFSKPKLFVPFHNLQSMSVLIIADFWMYKDTRTDKIVQAICLCIKMLTVKTKAHYKKLLENCLS